MQLLPLVDSYSPNSQEIFEFRQLSSEFFKEGENISRRIRKGNFTNR